MATYTPGQMAAILDKAGKEGRKALVNGIRRGLNSVRRYAAEEFRTRGIGRAIFGDGAAGARKGLKGARAMFARGKVTTTADTISGTMRMKGFAALQEAGGRTRAHTIRPRNAAGRLVFVAGGQVVSVKEVSHPGSQMPALPVIPSAVGRAEAGIRQMIARVYEDSLRATVDGSGVFLQ